jgi:tRNA (mo5U34)-methyltransferase
VLDVGTHDGYWAFEMERIGAAEVVAIDIDDPEQIDWPARSPSPDAAAALMLRRQRAFGIAHGLLHSRVEARSLSVYDLTTARIGRFDFAIVGTLLLHLRDPIAALAAIRRVASAILVNDVISLSLTVRQPRRPAARFLAQEGQPFWWVPNLAGLRQYVRGAGWTVQAAGSPYLVPWGAGHRRASLIARLRNGSELIDELALVRGAPHAWVLATG